MPNQRSDAEPLRERKGEHPYGDAGQVVLLILFLIVWMPDSFFLHESTFLSNYIPTYIRILVLVLTIATALILFKSGPVVISHQQRPTAVVTNGAFRYVRHPLYLAGILGYLGSAISTFSLASLALVLGIFIFYDYIAGYEEGLLEAKFGNKYRTHKDRTGKWVPRISTERLSKPWT